MFIMPLYGSSRRKVPLRQKLCQGAASTHSLTAENTGQAAFYRVAREVVAPTFQGGLVPSNAFHSTPTLSHSGCRYLSCKAREIVLRFSILKQASFRYP